MLEDLTDMMGMFLGIMKGDHDFIQVDEGIPVDEIPKDLIHQGLEDCLGIGEVKRHDEVFEMLEGCQGGICLHGLPLCPE